MSDLNDLSLRNRLPQNVTCEMDAREVAKDIVKVEIPEYPTLSDNAKKCVKHLTVGILCAFLDNCEPEERTLATMYDWILKNKYLKVERENNQDLEILDFAYIDDINSAKFHLCDNLMKYKALQ